MKRVVILDYGSGNLRSAERAFARSGVQVEVSSAADAAWEADGLVVPGVGAFAACMEGVRGVDGASVIAQRVDAGRPVLGICVGMQILFATGLEHGLRSEGIGIWPGTVDALTAPRLPHMGWNTVASPTGSILFAGLAGERFYFVHSYAARAWTGRSQAQVSWTEHGESFISAVEDGALCATQFHPEKSGDAGAGLIANWVGSL